MLCARRDVCGPTGFVEAVADALVALGHDATRIRTERRPVVIALDGNAIGADLAEVFGVDLTAAGCTCAACGASAAVAEAVVYMRGPGRVARCRACGACGALLIVLVTIRGITCVDLRGVARLQMEV